MMVRHLTLQVPVAADCTGTSIASRSPGVTDLEK